MQYKTVKQWTFSVKVCDVVIIFVTFSCECKLGLLTYFARKEKINKTIDLIQNTTLNV